ncbi:DUF2079 domain-containing protein [Ilumatobacter coccineus]|uniref:DUF2079 domain-containing protein n=1 Tax=Ilumatobacter coccineus (strain NBRC 103263 / KCTC 29153 / YM16-304) TaxID=1313172 RepID=A0A6C7E2V4_ILUCY|nr:DUF2079 domain-containing protein [Ilumatobacter coccineus]BAN02354.1 hypothetical protein YM304_20400 [Ilumatobacter coccineus YM16-304]
MTDLLDTDAPAHGDDVEPAVSPTLRQRVEAWVFGVTAAQAVLASIVVLYVWYFTQRSLDIHHALGTASYDSALYDQGVWLLSRGEAPFVTLMGRNLFGDHTSFVLLLLVPFYWIWPAAGVLFFAQSAAIGAGAIPVFLYGRRRLGSEWLALLAAAGYLVHPAIGWTNLENFHPDAFLGVFVGFAIYAALEHKWRMYLVFVVLALSVKEDASLVLVPLGVWVGVKRSWKIGLATVLGSVAFMAVAMFVVMRGLIGVPTRNTWRLPFSREGDGTLRAGLRIVDTAVTNPTDLVDHLRSDGRPWYLWQMTAPFAWLFLRLPTVAAISGLVLFTNILSTFWYQYQIEYHYALVAVPALSLGTIHAIGAMRERREVLLEDPVEHPDGSATDRSVGVGAEAGDAEGAGPVAVAAPRSVTVPVRAIAIAVLAASSLVGSYLWSPVPWGRTELFYGQPDNDWANAARDLIELVPGDAVLSAHYRITPHTAHRTEIYQFPTPFRSVLYGPNGNVDGPRIPDRAERVEYVLLPVTTDAYPHDDWLLIQEAFDLVDANDHWILYERDFDIPLPPERGS